MKTQYFTQAKDHIEKTSEPTDIRKEPPNKKKAKVINRRGWFKLSNFILSVGTKVTFAEIWMGRL